MSGDRRGLLKGLFTIRIGWGRSTIALLAVRVITVATSCSRSSGRGSIRLLAMLVIAAIVGCWNLVIAEYSREKRDSIPS